MKRRNIDDLRRTVNDIKYAESISYYGKRIREEEAKRFYEAESRAYKEHEERVRRESRSRGTTTPVTLEYAKTALNISLIISTIFAVVLFITGTTDVLESLAVAIVGTGILTFKSLT